MRWRNFTLHAPIKGKPQHTVRVEVHGDHGVKPPVRDLTHVVQQWVDAVFVNWKYKIDFGLHVECRRIPANKDFYGVRVINVPNHNASAVELRVRPRRSQYQWLCYLICDHEDTAWGVLKASRPNAVNYINDYDASDAAPAPPKHQAPAGRLTRWANQRIQQDQQSRRFTRELMRRAMLRELCGRLDPEAKLAGIVTREALRRSLSETLRRNVANGLFVDLLFELISNGIFDPVPDQVDQLQTTLLFDEYAAAYLIRQDKSEQERLTRERETLLRLRDAAVRDKERAQAQVEEAEQRFANLSDRIKDVDELLK
jgi:hypothetical protein